LSVVLPTTAIQAPTAEVTKGSDLAKVVLAAKVADFADLTSPTAATSAPKVADYAAAGITSVTPDNLAVVNTAVKAAEVAALQAQVGSSQLPMDPLAFIVQAAQAAAPNKAPGGTDKPASATEDTAYTLTATDFGFVDAAGETGALQSVIITALPTAGTLKLDDTDVTANQSISKADISGGKLVFQAATNASGEAYATIKFKVQDDGGTVGAGAADTSTTENTLTFNVAAVNDAPTGNVTISRADRPRSDLDGSEYVGRCRWHGSGELPVVSKGHHCGCYRRSHQRRKEQHFGAE